MNFGYSLYHLQAAGLFLPNISLYQTEGVFCTISVASFIAMGSIHTWSDQGMTDVISCTESSLHIRTIVRIYIHCKTYVIFLCKLHQAAYDLVIIRSAAVFCTDRNFPFCTHQSIAYTAHIH